MSLSSQDIQLLSSIGDWANRITFVFTAVALPIAVLFNIANLLVFTRKRLNQTNMGFLYVCQTLVDIMLLVFTTFTMGSTFIFGIEIARLSDFSCRMVLFMRQVTVHASSWMTVLISVDRFVFIRFPQRAQFLKNKSNWALIMALTLIAIAAVDAPNLAYYLNVTYSQSGNSTIEKRSCSINSDISAVNSVVSVLTRTYVPIVVMVTLNFVMIQHIRQMKNKVVSNRSQSKHENTFVSLVLSQNLVYFVINAPTSVCYLLSNLLRFGYIQMSLVNSAIFNLAFLCSVVFSYFYQMFSFFWHFALNKLFRRELLQTIAAKNRVDGSTFSSPL
nr:G protein-coupled receptor [Proales similis]